MISLKFRRAVLADIEAMSAIRLAVKENVLSHPGKVTRQMYEDYLDAAGCGWVCECDGGLVGFAYAATADASIWALFVQPGCEGLGVGRGLLQLAVAWLFAQGVDEVRLNTGIDTRADRFYQALGWQRGEPNATGDVAYRLARSQWAKSCLQG